MNENNPAASCSEVRAVGTSEYIAACGLLVNPGLTGNMQPLAEHPRSRALPLQPAFSLAASTSTPPFVFTTPTSFKWPHHPGSVHNGQADGHSVSIL
jgi:hypothetical protein